jgi:hypothetical protein
MSKQTQRLWLGEEKQDVILRDVVSCSGNMTSGREVLSPSPVVGTEVDHVLQSRCGACEGNSHKGHIALERSSPCISPDGRPVWYCLRIDNSECKHIEDTVFCSPPPPTAEEPRRSCSAPHLTFLNSLHPAFLAASYFQTSLQLPISIFRYTHNRPPLSTYHARQAIA